MTYKTPEGITDEVKEMLEEFVEPFKERIKELETAQSGTKILLEERAAAIRERDERIARLERALVSVAVELSE